jgi:hypothetical protein
MKLELIQPTSWSDISFNQWKRLLALHMIEDLNPLEKRIKQAAILNPHIESEEQIGKLTMPQLMEYFSTIEFIDNEPVSEIFKKFDLDGKTYKQIDFKDISLAQWIDAEKYSLDVLQHHHLIAIFYIKPDEYNDIIRDEIAEFIDTQPCSKVFYLISQFFFIQTALEKTMLAYSQRVEKKKAKIEKVIKRTNQIEKFLRKRLGSIYYTE